MIELTPGSGSPGFGCTLSPLKLRTVLLAHTVYISSIHHLIHSSPWPVFSPSYRCPIAFPLKKHNGLSSFYPFSHRHCISSCFKTVFSTFHPPMLVPPSTYIVLRPEPSLFMSRSLVLYSILCRHAHIHLHHHQVMYKQLCIQVSASISRSEKSSY